jgi:TfoX/Sxy family transcriptional regulator of competence genes
MPEKSKDTESTESKAAMPVWRKAPPELILFFKELVRPYPQVELRAMFGYPCAFVNGYMTAGLFADRMFVKLDAAGVQKLLELPGAGPLEPSAGRLMSGYVLVPEDLRTSPGLEVWLEQAFAFAASLPPKVKKVKTKVKS